MYTLIILYICIVVFQIIYIHYLRDYIPEYKTDLEIKQDKKVQYIKKNELRIQSFLQKEVKEYVSLINDNKMTFDEWVNYIRKNKKVMKDGFKFNVRAFQSIPNNDDEVIVLQIPQTSYAKLKFDDLIWSNALLIKESNQLSGTKFVNPKFPLIMKQNSKLNKVDEISYFTISPDTDEIVLEHVFYTKWKSKEGYEGIFALGYDTEVITEMNDYEYITFIYKPELILTSVLCFSIALIIYYIKSFKYAEFKSIAFLILTNLYLLIFLTTKEVKTDIPNEIEKITNINSGILGLSFLSGISIFIMNFVYKKHVKLFSETAFIFGVSILLLLTAVYKSTNQNFIDQIIGARITNQLVFNMSVFLNAAIIINFLIYSIFIEKSSNISKSHAFIHFSKYLQKMKQHFF